MMAKAGDLRGVAVLNDGFLRDVEMLISRLKTWLDEHDQNSGKPRLYSPDTSLLADLCHSLVEYDMNGIDKAMELLKRADYETNADLVKWLEEKITESEFDDAAQRILDYLEEYENGI